MSTNTVDFNNAANWTGLSADHKSLDFQGMTAVATGGALIQWHGVSVDSPSDSNAEGWTHELDSWNDGKEGISFNFDQPQTGVSVTLAMMYQLWIWIVEPEKANYTATLSDGTTVTGVVYATATQQPGEVSFTVDSSLTGGKTITSLYIEPSPDLNQIPAPNPRPNTPNFQRPFSTITIGSITYSYDNHPVTISAENGHVVETIGTPAPAAQLGDTGHLTFTDADLTDTHTLAVAPVGTTLGALSLVVDNDSTGGVTGQATWTYNVDASKLEYLAAGQTLIESFTVTVDDGQGNLTNQQIDVTLTGTNDSPLINAAQTVATGAVAEQANTINSAAFDTANGVVAFTDVDLADLHTASAAPNGTTLGSLSLGVIAEGPGAGSLGWTYSVEDKKLDYLAAGQTKVETFDVTVDDGHGGTAVQTISITLTGSNDAPTINGEATTAAGAVTEKVNTLGSSALDTTTGTVAFKDVDLTDTHTASAAPVGSALGALTLGVITEGPGAGSLGWSYAVEDKKLDYLAVGQTKVETFNVTIDDGQGGTTVQPVTITITGTNDKPTIDAAGTVATGAVTEKTNTTGSSVLDTAVGTVAFKDVDLIDTHTALVAPVGATLGAVVLGPVTDGSGAGSLGWTYQVQDSKLDYLAAGQKKVELFNVTVDDGHGGTAQQALTITLTGSNDVPTFVVPSVTTGTVTDKIDTNGCYHGFGCWSDWWNDCFNNNNGSSQSTATGKLYFKDVDLTDTHVLSVAAVGSTLGSLTLSGKTESNGSGSLSWTYKVTDDKLEYLGAGETRQEVFNVKLDDGHGGVTIQPVTITLVGVNDCPTAVNNCFSVKQHQATGNLWSSILANDHDPDKSDVLTITSVNTSKTDGMVLLNSATHTLLYVADADSFNNSSYCGSPDDSFGYTISDGHGGTDSATVTMNIQSVTTKLGTNGADTGSFGSAVVYDAGRGADKITGSGYADTLLGGDGDDYLMGAGGDDTLYGEAGDDKLDGGAGTDVLLGGSGQNSLIGGAGSDFFVFSKLTVKDTVNDFVVGTDHLYFEQGLGVSQLKQAGGNTTLTLTDGAQVVLLGVSGHTDWHTFL